MNRNWKASGLTQVAYCQQHAIKPHIFSYYKKKFSAAPAAAKKDKLMPDKKPIASAMAQPITDLEFPTELT
jgi:hypothetical protein